MSAAPRLGLFTPGWPGQNTPNGIATSVYHLALGLQDIGQPPVIIAEHLDGDAPQGIPVVHIPQLEWRWQDRIRARLGHSEAGHWYRSRNIAAGIHTATAEHGLDVIIMEETHGWAGMVQQLVPVPVIIALHGPWVLHKSLQSVRNSKDDRNRECRESRAFAAAPGLMSPSRDVLASMEKALRLPDKPRGVVPNAFPAEAGAPLAADQPRADILFVGRFDLHKGGDTVLEAFSDLVRTHPHARLTFAGIDKGLRQADGSLLHIDTALSALPETVRACITYMGPLDRAEISRLRRRHAIALIASRYENLNYTLLEAMAAGQAIVCTRVGGPADVLEDEKTALFVPPSDPEAMADALRRLMDTPALAVSLGTGARAKLTDDFDPARVAIQTLDFVRRVLVAPSGRQV